MSSYALIQPFSDSVDPEMVREFALRRWAEKVAGEECSPVGEPVAQLGHVVPGLRTMTMDDGTTYEQPPHWWRIEGLVEHD
jgi:hypothetical protein